MRGSLPKRHLEVISPPVPSLQPMVELNQRTGRDPRHTRENTSYHTGTVRRVGTTHFLLRRHVHSRLGLGEERENAQQGPDSVPTAPPSTRGRHCGPVSPSRRETLACGSGPSEAEALSLSDTLRPPRTSTTACGVFQTHSSTSDPKTRPAEPQLPARD